MRKSNTFTYGFEKLEVWQEARIIKKNIFLLTRKFPKEKGYGLSSQLRRSISSVTANLAEGSGRASQKDKARFTNMVFTSALETLDHIITAWDISYIDESTYLKFRSPLEKLMNKLNALYKYQCNSSGNHSKSDPK